MWFIILSDILFHQKFRNAPASVLNLLPPPHGGKLQWLPLNGTAGLRLGKNCLLGLLSLPLSGKFASCALVHGAWQKEFGFLVPWPAKVYSFISSSLNCMVKVSFRITKFLDSHFCRFIKLYFNTYLHSILWILSSFLWSSVKGLRLPVVFFFQLAGSWSSSIYHAIRGTGGHDIQMLWKYKIYCQLLLIAASHKL